MTTKKNGGVLPLLDELNYSSNDVDLSKPKKTTIYDDFEEEEVFSPVSRNPLKTEKQEIVYIEDFDEDIEDITDEDLGNEVEDEYEEEAEPFIRQVIDIDSIDFDPAVSFKKSKQKEVVQEEEDNSVHKLSKMPKLKSSKKEKLKNRKDMLKNPKVIYAIYGAIGLFIIAIILLLFGSKESSEGDKAKSEKIPVVTKVVVNDNSYSAVIKKGTTINGTASLYGAIKTKQGVSICSATDAPTKEKESTEILLECDLQPQDSETIEDFVFDVTTE